jgi:hypothetical protein
MGLTRNKSGDGETHDEGRVGGFGFCNWGM